MSGVPQLKGFLHGVPPMDLVIGELRPGGSGTCARCLLNLVWGEKSAAVWERKPDHRKGKVLGTICAKCRDEADDTKRAVLAAFDRLGRKL